MVRLRLNLWKIRSGRVISNLAFLLFKQHWELVYGHSTTNKNTKVWRIIYVRHSIHRLLDCMDVNAIVIQVQFLVVNQNQSNFNYSSALHAIEFIKLAVAIYLKLFIFWMQSIFEKLFIWRFFRSSCYRTKTGSHSRHFI